MLKEWQYLLFMSFCSCLGSHMRPWSGSTARKRKPRSPNHHTGESHFLSRNPALDGS